MKRLAALLVLTAFFCVGAAFSYQNSAVVAVDYMFGQIELPLGLALMAVFGGTLLLALILAGTFSVGQRAELRRLRRKLESADSELRNLRNLPLKNP